MADLQTTAFLATVNPMTWTNTANGPREWVFSPDGTEVWWHLDWTGDFSALSPRVVRLAWPALTVINDMSLNWSGYKTTGDTSGWPIAASGANKLVVARLRHTTTPYQVDIDEWTLDTSSKTTLATFTGSPPGGTNWHAFALAWDTVADVGYALMGDWGGENIRLYKIERNGTKTLLDGPYKQVWGGESNFAAVFVPTPDFSQIHFVYSDYTGATGWRAAYLVTATGSVVKGTSSKVFKLYPGLAHVGAEPFGNGAIYYPGTGAGFDLGSINDPGTGTQRTTAAISPAPFDHHQVRANRAHTVGGYFRAGSTSDRWNWYQFGPEYVPPDPPPTLLLGPTTGYIGPGAFMG